MRAETNPLGSCLYSIFFRVPAVQTRPSSLHLLQGNSPSHCRSQKNRAHIHGQNIHLCLLHSTPLAGLPYPLVSSVRGRGVGVAVMRGGRGVSMDTRTLGCPMYRLDRLGTRVLSLLALGLEVVLVGRCWQAFHGEWAELWSNGGGVSRV